MTSAASIEEIMEIVRKCDGPSDALTLLSMSIITVALIADIDKDEFITTLEGQWDRIDEFYRTKGVFQ